VKSGLDVAQMWLDGDETLVNTVDRNGDVLPINMTRDHSLTHDPLVVLVSSSIHACSSVYFVLCMTTKITMLPCKSFI
jgi:carboxyl-terminal processing protease